jgi:hypothetical protein
VRAIGFLAHSLLLVVPCMLFLQVRFSLYSSHAPRTIARNLIGFDFAVL